MSELVTARIRTIAAKMGLPHLAEHLGAIVTRADEAQMGYLDFLDLVLEEEHAVREERRIRHALSLIDIFSFTVEDLRRRAEAAKSRP